ncbi:MAG: hypothetical protein NC300_04190 [Bacteroidales bacterium]|nr:hypothetical protein [Clostridium sp.]MCM1203322.1 hypothetical protein [Bacteroidales bacterium]
MQDREKKIPELMERNRKKEEKAGKTADFFGINIEMKRNILYDYIVQKRKLIYKQQR